MQDVYREGRICMKIDSEVYCKEHGEELTITDVDIAPIAGDKVTQKTVVTYVKPCSQCMSESYEKGIESLLKYIVV